MSDDPQQGRRGYIEEQEAMNKNKEPIAVGYVMIAQSGARQLRLERPGMCGECR